MSRLEYSVTRSYSVGIGGASDISLEFRTTEPRTVPEYDLASESILPFLSSPRAELKEKTRKLEETLESDIFKLERTIEAAVDNLVAAVRLLDAGIRERTRTVARNKAILAPIRRLPPEILRQVLAYAGSAALPKNSNALSSKMLVCKTWCQAILDTPQLWTRLDLTNTDFQYGSSQEFMQYVLTRGKFLPLDIRITIDNVFLYQTRTNPPLLKTMMSRCKSLDLQLRPYSENDGFYEDEIDCIFEAIAPSKLVHLSISINCDEDTQMELSLGESIAAQKSLSRVQHHLQSLEIEHVDFLPEELRMPHLEKLKLRGTVFDISHLRKWTLIAPNLLHLCMLEFYGYRNWEDPTSSPPCFLQLHFLELHLQQRSRTWRAGGEAILTACKHVQTLILNGICTSIDIPLLRMQNLKRLVLPQAKRPELPEHGLHLDQHLAEWFSCMPNLECLQISHRVERALHQVPDESMSASPSALLFMALTPKNISHSRICPRLTSLIYTLKSGDKEQSGLTTDVIDTVIALSRSQQKEAQNSSLKVTVTLEYEPEVRHNILRTTIAEDADYNDLLHAFRIEPAID